MTTPATVSQFAPHRQVRIGASYLHGVAADAHTAYGANEVTRRLLGQFSGTARAQYSALMIPPYLQYLLHPAYEYGGPRTPSEVATNDSVAELAVASRRVSNVDQDRSTHEVIAPSAVSRAKTKETKLPQISGPSNRPTTPALIEPRLQEESALADVRTRLNAASAEQRAGALSLRELGRALEAHNFSPDRSANLAVADRLPDVSATKDAAALPCSRSSKPTAVASPAQPLLPTTKISIPSSESPSEKRAAPDRSAQSATHGEHGVSNVVVATPLSIPRSTLPIMASHSTKSALPRNSEADELAVTQRAISPDNSVVGQPRESSLALQTLKRKVLRESITGSSKKKEATVSKRPLRKERPALRPAAPRARAVQRVPLAFLERSQLAQMRLRLFR